MHTISNELIIFIVLTVLLIMALGVAIIIIIDHKARIPGDFVKHPLAIIGKRHDHPVISFITATILICIISFLILEVTIVMAERLGVFNHEGEGSNLLEKLHEQRFTERMRHFHNEPEQNLVDLGKKQACFYCHGDYPHSKTPMIRAINNMHTQFIGCMTCHTDEKKVPEDTLKFNWLNYSGIEVTGLPYGSDINPETGFLVKTDDYYSKIVAYTQQGGEDRLLELTEDDPEIQEFAALVSGGDLTDEDREGLKRRFHKQILEKGRKCKRCHTKEDESYLPLQQLGFSVQRIEELTNLNIVGIVDKYEDFYMPALMREDETQ
jgi:cytochrome c553